MLEMSPVSCQYRPALRAQQTEKPEMAGRRLTIDFFHNGTL